jgi:single-stranded DNA-binding protein
MNTDNMVILSGNMVRDAELVMNDRRVRFSIAVNRSGYEKESDNDAGFFNCEMWVTESDYSPVASAKNVKKLFDEGKLVKGTRVRLVGSIRQDRAVIDGNKRDFIKVEVDELSAFVASTNQNASSTDSPSSSTTAAHEEPF